MTKPSDRDLDRLLKWARLQPAGAPAGACLDAETLAAWADGTLSVSEHAAAERHAADCARCQAMLAAMMRTAPPETVPAERWSPWRFTRWAVPLSAAAALALWFAVDRDAGQRQPTESVSTAPSQSVASPSPSAPAASDVAPGAASSAAAQPPPLADSQSTDPSSARRARRTANARTSGARAELDAAKETTAKDASPPPAVPNEEERRASTAPAAAPPPPDAKPETPRDTMAKAAPPPAAPSPEASPAPPTLAETVVTPQATQQVDSQSRGPSQARFRRGVAQSVARTVWVDVPSPDPLVKWRFSAGTVEQSTDGGVTWTRQPVGSPALIVAGAAPSSFACWFVGSGGLVLRFTTARGWQSLLVPNAPDLVAVQAKDADNATVVLANGRRLTTSDGGATWR